MASEGPNSPVTVVNDASVGDIAWTNPGNGISSNDVYATAVIGMGMTSQYLKATEFGFAIPAGATIDGITVAVERKGTQAQTGVKDSEVKIVKGGTIGTTNKLSADIWPTTDAYKTYGGATDLWGETWTSTDINATNFGMVILATLDTLDETASVDHIRITINYTETGGGNAGSSSSDAYTCTVNII